MPEGFLISGWHQKYLSFFSPRCLPLEFHAISRKMSKNRRRPKRPIKKQQLSRPTKTSSGNGFGDIPEGTVVGIMADKLGGILNQERSSAPEDGSSPGSEAPSGDSSTLESKLGGSNITINLPGNSVSPDFVDSSEALASLRAELEATRSQLEASQANVERLTHERDDAVTRVQELEATAAETDRATGLMSRLMSASETVRAMMTPIDQAKFTPAGYNRLFGKDVTLPEFAATFASLDDFEAHIVFVEQTINFQQSLGVPVISSPSPERTTTSPLPEHIQEYRSSDDPLGNALGVAASRAAGKYAKD